MRIVPVLRPLWAAFRVAERPHQVGVLVMVLLIQVVVFCWRESDRSNIVPDHEDLPGPLRALPLSTASRDDKQHGTTAAWCDWPEHTPALNRPERFKLSLPAGQEFAVTVRGEITATLDEWEYDVRRSRHVFYAFETQYQRTIESNDGRCVVERRDYRNVKRVKLLVPVGDAPLPSEPFCDWSFATLDFPHPSNGIGLVPANYLAGVLLRPDLHVLAKDEWCRGYTEQDDLSGRSVRLTYVDGVGIESVEAIGWSPTSEQMRYLTQRSVLLDCCAPVSSKKDQRRPRWIRSDRVVELVADPTFEMRRDAQIGLLTLNNASVRHRDLWATHENARKDPDHRVIGTMRIEHDAKGKFVRSAEMSLKSDAFWLSKFHLLHEDLQQADTRAIVRYDCSLM
jgi:hypothetical protein